MTFAEMEMALLARARNLAREWFRLQSQSPWTQGGILMDKNGGLQASADIYRNLPDGVTVLAPLSGAMTEDAAAAAIAQSLWKAPRSCVLGD